jgi:WD40 repeat protein
MTERQLRLAITEPAKKAGSKVDDDLADLLLAEVRTGQPGAFGAGVLPLLSHALDQAWRCRAGESLTLADYDRAGGIEGAVAASAQRAYDALTPAQQAAARQVFLRLTATSADGIDTAGRATRAELTEGKSLVEAQDVAAVLEAFAAERLLTLAASTVELNHEVLLTAWPLLRDTWLADTHADRIVRTRLHHTAADWARHSRDPSYLYAGTLLQAATDTAARAGADPSRHPPLSQTETDFLHASGRARRRAARRRRGLIALLTALVLGLAAATVVAIHASQQVARQRDIAISGLLISQSQQLRNANPTLSRLLSVAAWRIDPSSAARYAMLAAAAARPGMAVLTSHGGAVTSVAFSQDGTILATGNADGTVRLWNAATHRPIAILTGHTGAVTSVAFSQDGTTLATGNADGTVRLWNAATHRLIRTLTSRDGRVNSVAFSPDGTTLATGNADGTIRLWDAATRRPVSGPPTSHGGPVFGVAFGPGGTTLASGNDNGTVSLWSLVNGSCTGGPLISDPKRATSIALSPDGTTLAAGNADGTIRLWDTATGSPASRPLTGPAGPVTSIAFSPDSTTLASANPDHTVRLWDLATSRPVGAPLTGHTGPVTSVAFSPDGKTLATGSTDHTVRLWNVAYLVNVAPHLCAMAGRSLTRAEWERYVPGLVYQQVCS